MLMRLMYLDREARFYMLDPWIDEGDFRHALFVYQNNQEYYHHNQMFTELKGLEHWFIHVIEPIPVRRSNNKEVDKDKRQFNIAINKWLEKELIKKRGYTHYCKQSVRGRVYQSSSSTVEINKFLDLVNVMIN